MAERRRRLWRDGDSSATGPHDAWAVGSCGTLTSPAYYRGIIEHWDGFRWAPAKAPDAFQYESVVALAPDDVWVLGTLRLPGGAPLSSLIHWDGQRWAIATDGLPYGTLFLSLQGTSARNLWAVVSISDESVPIRWDGASWRKMPPPGMKSSEELDYDLTLSGTDVWVKGEGAGRPALAHHDGSGWSQVPTPIRKRFGSIGWQVAVGRELWVIGSEHSAVTDDMEEDPIDERDFFARWDGRTWTRHPKPRPDCEDFSLEGGGWATCTSPDLLFWNGSRWVEQPMPPGGYIPNPPRQVPGTRSYWASTYLPDVSASESEGSDIMLFRMAAE